MSDTRTIVVAAAHITTRDGRRHTQGATVTLGDVEARDLIRAGRVREVKPEPADPPSSPKPATKPATTEKKEA